MKKIEKILNSYSIRNIISKYLKCKWCNKEPQKSIKEIELLTKGICSKCLIKEYSAYL